MESSPELLNRERARRLMEQRGLAALIATRAVNVTYATGFRSPSPHVFPDMQVFALLAADGEDRALVIPRDEVTYVGTSPISVSDVRVYGETTLQWSDNGTYNETETEVRRLMMASPRFRSPADALHAAIVDRGLQTARLGIDEAGVAPAHLRRLRELLPGAELVDAADLWTTIRAVKTAAEMDYLRQASTVNEAGLAASIAVLKPGATQADAFMAYQDKVVQGGGALVYWGGGVGSQSSLYGPIVPNYRGRVGDLIRTDGAMTRQLYWADTGRTAVLGPPSSKQKTYYAALHEGLLAGLALVRPGTRPSDIFNAIVDTVQRAGIAHYFRFHCGHGIGLDFYESPGIRPIAKDSAASELALEENMIFNVEVPYYELGFGGMQIEETLRVTADGYEVITTYPRDLVVK